LRGVVDRARKKTTFFSFKKNYLAILFTSNYKIMPHMPSNYIQSKANLGKIIPVPLKYLIFAMQNSSCGTPHGSDFL
jgi:hypothetical protein